MIPALNILLARRVNNEALRQAGGDPNVRGLRDSIVVWTKEAEAHLRKAGKFRGTSKPKTSTEVGLLVLGQLKDLTTAVQVS